MITAIFGLSMATRDSHDAAMGMMRCSNELRSLAFGASSKAGMMDMDALANRELQITLDKQSYEMQYLINQNLKESYQKLVDKRIKESFSTFA